MSIVKRLHIFVTNRDAVSESRGPKSNDGHVEFVVAALKIFIQLAFGHCNACHQESLNFVERQLIADQLLDMLFAEPHWPQAIPHEFAELVHIESRVTLKRRQLAH